MARTILEIAREAAERDNTAPAPQSLFTTPSKVANILRIAARDTIREFLRQQWFTGLSEFHATWVFALQPGRYAYPMPPDYLRMIAGTEQRGGWPMAFIGPASPQAWADWVFGATASPTNTGWRIRNGAIFVDPTPASEELVAIEYISSWPVVGPMTNADVDLSGSIPIFTAGIVPRDGAIYLTDADLLVPDSDETLEFDEEPGYDEGLWATDPMEVLRRIKPTTVTAPFPQVRRAEFTTDADRPAFEDDYLLSLGMTFRLRRALGKPYEEHAAEYEAEMESRIAGDAGGARPFRIGQRMDSVDVVPLGAGKWLIS